MGLCPPVSAVSQLIRTGAALPVCADIALLPLNSLVKKFIDIFTGWLALLKLTSLPLAITNIYFSFGLLQKMLVSEDPHFDKMYIFIYMSEATAGSLYIVHSCFPYRLFYSLGITVLSCHKMFHWLCLNAAHPGWVIYRET